MTPRRRALLLLALATLLAVLAATDVARREAAVEDAIGPAVPVVVARREIAAGARLTLPALAIRRVPEWYAPAVRYDEPRAVAGLRAAVTIPADVDVTPALVLDRAGADGAAAPVGLALRPGRRVAQIVAQGSPGLVSAGSRVDVLVTRERSDGSGETTLALEDAQVVAAAPAPAADDGPRVAVSLLVTVRQAVFLTAAQAFARELRVLPRAPGDRRHGRAGTTVGSSLR
jgi:pilus assembly protein CpaB